MLKNGVTYVIQDHVKAIAAPRPIIIDAIGDLRTKFQEPPVLLVQRRVAHAEACVPAYFLSHGKFKKSKKKPTEVGQEEIQGTTLVSILANNLQNMKELVHTTGDLRRCSADDLRDRLGWPSER